MAWPITNWAGNPDWAAIANVSAFVGAVNERLTVAGGTPLPTKAVGDDVQAAAWFASMQAAVEGVLAQFVVSHAAGTPLGSGYYDGKDAIPSYVNLAALFSAAGLATSTWRAYTTHPDDAGVDQERGIQAGDIIGPWLFEDLQKVLNVLVWQYAGPALAPWESVEKATEGKIGGGNSGYDEPPLWSTAKTNAEAAFAAAEIIDNDTQPRGDAESWGLKNLTQPIYGAALNRRRSKWTISGIPTSLAHTIDFYVFSTPFVGGFDANGDDVIENKWSLFDTTGPTTAASVESGWLGSLDQPNWCAEPVDEPGTALGWIQAAWNAIVRWDVAGGLVFC